MARTRVIYQSEAVYCSQDVAFDADQTAAGAIKQLSRVQSANYSFSVARQDVNQFGNLAAIDQIITESPTVSFDTSYYLANFSNEARLGFSVTASGDGVSPTFASCIENIIDSSTNDYQKDYYLLTTKEGKDANDNTTTGDFSYGASIIGIGNAFLSSYSSEGAVGGLPTVSVSVEGQNMNFVNLPFSPTGVTDGTFDGMGLKMNAAKDTVTYISGENPAVNATNGEKVGLAAALPVPLTNSTSSAAVTAGGNTITTLRPGDITLTLAKQTATNNTATTLWKSTSAGNNMDSPDYAGTSIDDSHIQSYNISFDLSRSPIQKLGNRFAFARSIDFPVNVSLSVDAVLSDLTTGSLADIINCDHKFDAKISLKEPECAPGAVKNVICNYILKGLKLDSQSFSSDIGSNKTVTLDFSSQVGGPDQFDHGIFMSGFNNA
jgi:hypothetical protein